MLGEGLGSGPALGLLQVSLSIQSSHLHRWPSTWPQETPRGRRFPQAYSGQAASSDQRTDVLTPLPSNGLIRKLDKGNLGQQAQTLQPTKIRAELERMLLCSDHTQIAGSR
ncbi:unnamed protein product [Rangifer tarandus platyrhynchus]|uniref:Uncharacterized protein n=1 Tax=Rangifer tarandus platyrhynchus TaxID=3082113 RepID=A0ACB1MMD7_RANTA